MTTAEDLHQEAAILQTYIDGMTAGPTHLEFPPEEPRALAKTRRQLAEVLAKLAHLERLAS